MAGPVSFDYAQWSARYPELAGSVNSALAQIYFTEAGLYCDNTASSPVDDPNVLLMLLNMLVAHIAALNASIGGQPATPLVGRISNATEGSVSVQTQNDYPPGTPQWFQQTKYGSAFWAATARWRSGFYVANPARPTDPFVPVYGYPN